MKFMKKKYQKKYKRVIEFENRIKNFIERVKFRRKRNFSTFFSLQTNFSLKFNKKFRSIKFSNFFVFIDDKIF